MRTAGGTVTMARAILVLDPRVKETLDIYLEAGRGSWKRFSHSAGIAEFKRWYTEAVPPYEPSSGGLAGPNRWPASKPP
ncbi:MAG: hypothetical protein AB1609_16930 [Bacillota bacterium]